MSNYFVIDGQLVSADELYHHGVKGQKWGVRRFQNKDGSLTPEGEKRYYNDDGSLTKHGRRALDSNQIPLSVERSHLKKLHDSKPKKADDPSINYHDRTASMGKKYVRELVEQLREGYVTSFKEDSNGRVANGPGKTKRGVVIRDKDGNRVTMVDYLAARNAVRAYGRRIYTGDFG